MVFPKFRESRSRNCHPRKGAGKHWSPCRHFGLSPMLRPKGGIKSRGNRRCVPATYFKLAFFAIAVLPVEVASSYITRTKALLLRIPNPSPNLVNIQWYGFDDLPCEIEHGANTCINVRHKPRRKNEQTQSMRTNSSQRWARSSRQRQTVKRGVRWTSGISSRTQACQHGLYVSCAPT